MQIIITRCTWLGAPTPIRLFCSNCESIDRELNGKRWRRIYAFNRSAIEPIGAHSTGRSEKSAHFSFQCLRALGSNFRINGHRVKCLFVFSAGCAVIDAMPFVCSLAPSSALIYRNTLCANAFHNPQQPNTSPPPDTIQYLINAHVIRIEMDSFSRCWLWYLARDSLASFPSIPFHLISNESDGCGCWCRCLAAATSMGGNRSTISFIWINEWKCVWRAAQE